MSYFFLSSPYSHESKKVEEDRFNLAKAACAWLLNKKVMVFSPIVHCHPIAISHSLPVDHNHWMEYNRTMLTPARGIIILAVSGWVISKGVRFEVEIGSDLGKPFQLLRHSDEQVMGKDGPVESWTLSGVSREELKQRLG